MKPSIRLLVAAMLLGACSRAVDKAEAPASRSSAVLSPSSAPAVRPTSLTAPAAVEPRHESPKVEDEDLKTEEAEVDPYSEGVALKLSVTPQVKALVNWGAKQMARLEPGKMEVEITRPRGSGPLDLEIRAEGYMPYHTRLYADRNDKLGVRLYRPEESPSLFGYKRSVEGKK
jgi:hypothetical protein